MARGHLNDLKHLSVPRRGDLNGFIRLNCLGSHLNDLNGLNPPAEGHLNGLNHLNIYFNKSLDAFYINYRASI